MQLTESDRGRAVATCSNTTPRLAMGTVGLVPALASRTEDNSRIMCNRIHGNVDGILMQSGGSGNLLRGNLVSGNQGSGLGMMGYYWQDPDSGQEYYYAMPSGNTIRSNIVENNPWNDLFEVYWDWGSEMCCLIRMVHAGIPGRRTNSKQNSECPVV